jgi:hypothetical protein
VNHHEQPKRGAESEEDKAFLFMEGLGILQEEGLLIEEDRLRLLESDAVFPLVGVALPWIPLKPDLAHGSMYMHCMYTGNPP